MFSVFKNAWKIQDLRKKIIFTLFIIVLFRIGSAIPVPFIEAEALKAIFNVGTGTNFLGYLNTLSGGALEKATVFALSISPYITASIVIQLLTIAIPALERLSKEGEEGRKKLANWTRYTTIILGAITAFGYYTMLKNSNALSKTSNTFETVLQAIIIISIFVTGACLIMWLGEKINEKGIGNGISIILFAGILARLPHFVTQSVTNITTGRVWVPIVGIIGGILMIAFVVVMNNAERRIPVQYAKRVVGRKVYGGQSTHIPMKVSMSGVMPIIFATSLISMPSMIVALFYGNQAPTNGFWAGVMKIFSQRSWVYIVLVFLLIVAFSYFYVVIQFNPIEVSNNLKKNGGFIPGIRPGKPTTEYISKILWRITFIGAMFLGIISVVPNIVDMFANVGLALGGTSLIIVVGVAIETVKQLESQMLMRHYKGFLE